MQLFTVGNDILH